MKVKLKGQRVIVIIIICLPKKNGNLGKLKIHRQSADDEPRAIFIPQEQSSGFCLPSAQQTQNSTRSRPMIIIEPWQNMCVWVLAGWSNWIVVLFHLPPHRIPPSTVRPTSCACLHNMRKQSFTLHRNYIVESNLFRELGSDLVFFECALQSAGFTHKYWSTVHVSISYCYFYLRVLSWPVQRLLFSASSVPAIPHLCLGGLCLSPSFERGVDSQKKSWASKRQKYPARVRQLRRGLSSR